MSPRSDRERDRGRPGPRREPRVVCVCPSSALLGDVVNFRTAVLFVADDQPRVLFALRVRSVLRDWAKIKKERRRGQGWGNNPGGERERERGYFKGANAMSRKACALARAELPQPDAQKINRVDIRVFLTANLCWLHFN